MSSAIEPAHPPGAGAAIHWPGVMHDVRGAATAIEALAALVADEAPALSPGTRGLLGLIQARAEQLSALCEAVALLQDRPAGSMPLSRILPAAVARLQKLLDRGGVRLKSMGGIPDTEVEARSMSVLVQSVLVAAINARDPAHPAEVAIGAHVVNGAQRITVELAGPGWGPAGRMVAVMACPVRSAELGAAGLAAHRALARLGAALHVHDDGRSSVIAIDLAEAAA